jgi:protein phosphatase
VIIADVTDDDIEEEAPVDGGAAANDRGMVSSADASTPAARASALTQPRDPAPADRDDDAGGRRRHPVRTILVLLVLAGLVGGGLWGGWKYTQSKYYVGVTTDGTIAVFQGIPGEIAGFELSTVDMLSTTKIEELTPVAQDKVREGIPSASQDEAREQLANLLDPQSKNVLPTVVPTATPTTAPPPITAPAAFPTTSPSGNPSPGSSLSPSTSAVPPPPAATNPPLPTGPPDCRPGT